MKKNINASSPDSLAYLLASPYRTDIEKARAIYSWIAQHISYNTFFIGNFRRSAGAYVAPEEDTTTIRKEADVMTAIKVLKRRTAVCDGYAKLFKTLCGYAGICSEVISGYARGHIERNALFRTNDNWNAVMIDGAWQLADVTWGSGYVNFANQFVQRTNDA
jgi:transglutaminase/protease-like cytokinesis protein 3